MTVFRDLTSLIRCAARRRPSSDNRPQVAEMVQALKWSAAAFGTEPVTDSRPRLPHDEDLRLGDVRARRHPDPIADGRDPCRIVRRAKCSKAAGHRNSSNR